MEHIDQDFAVAGISVSGVGRVAVAPEIATLSLGVSVENKDLESARDTVATKSTAARDHLLTAGVAESDIQTTRFNVHNSRDQQLRRQTFYVSTAITAVIRDLATAESVVNDLFSVVGPGLEMYGLTFTVEDQIRGRDQALTLAFEDANSKARLLAHLAGASLGSVLSISQTTGRAYEPLGIGQTRMSLAAESAQVPVEAGELEVTATIEVRWALEY